MNRKEKPVIGWREWISLPGLKNSKIKAKVDTGARTSSLHAYDVKNFTRKGKPWVRFEIHPLQDSKKGKAVVEAPLIEYRTVKSSSGHTEERPVIETEITLMGQQWPIEITLTKRDLMGFRMLLGRQAIRKRFVVDVGKSFLSKKLAKKVTNE